MKTTPKVKAPPGLNKRAAVLWGQVVPRRARTPNRQALIAEALQSLTRADECAARIEKEGLTVTSKSGVVRGHPLLATEKANRAAFVRIWFEMGLAADDRDYNPFPETVEFR